MSRVLIIDNFDSFTHNLAQLFGGLGADVIVRRNDAALTALLALAPDRVVLSPGPGRPESAGSSLAALRSFAGRVPVLGVCLGHQVLAGAFGARVTECQRPVHGRASELHHDGTGLFAGLPPRFAIARYHSLAVVESTLPPALRGNAWTADGVLQAVRHVTLPLAGIQFHPESVLTPLGERLARAFLEGRT